MHVKEKKVELIELFYDMIYVYAISRLTLLIEEPEGGIIPLPGFFRYLTVKNRGRPFLRIQQQLEQQKPALSPAFRCME